MRPAEPRGRGLWVGLALGAPVMAVGVRGALVNAERTHPASLARWIIGGAVVHDLVVIPVVLGVSLFVRRIVPSSSWPAVRWALATSGTVLLVGWPFLRGYGRRADNPSLLSRDYVTGVAVALVVVWVAALGWALIEARPRRRPP